MDWDWIFEGNDISSSIVFTTPCNEFALKAPKMNSIDYLLKPLSLDELSFSIDKFESFRADRLNLEQIRRFAAAITRILKTDYCKNCPKHQVNQYR